jgi:CBS domain containing-hemolysin-like protein
VHHHNNIPDVDEVIIINQFHFTIKEASNNKIDLVELIVNV